MVILIENDHQAAVVRVSVVSGEDHRKRNKAENQSYNVSYYQWFGESTLEEEK